MAHAERIREVAAEVRRRGAVAVLTGAGVSVESGIPDFRSPGGIWTRYDPMEFATIDAFIRNPRKVWPFLVELGEMLAGARPNPAHEALAALEAAGIVAGVATQNVDSLHQAAGSKRVLELHGGHGRLRCISCGRHDGRSLDEVRAGLRAGSPPTCEACGGLLKPDVVLFGELLPAGVFEEAEALVGTSPVLLVVGTSASVYPVAGLPALAARRGAYVVEVNLEETDLSADVADVSLYGKAGEILPALARAIETR
ncbi:MAG TPA: NAD-dependent deacylase [Planctomycetota bacterium]|nr:NAD-dependent deacylase [Planctomycetota bacterium]